MSKARILILHSDKLKRQDKLTSAYDSGLIKAVEGLGAETVFHDYFQDKYKYPTDENSKFAADEAKKLIKQDLSKLDIDALAVPGNHYDLIGDTRRYLDAEKTQLDLSRDIFTEAMIEYGRENGISIVMICGGFQKYADYVLGEGGSPNIMKVADVERDLAINHFPRKDMEVEGHEEMKNYRHPIIFKQSSEKVFEVAKNAVAAEKNKGLA